MLSYFLGERLLPAEAIKAETEKRSYPIKVQIVTKAEFSELSGELPHRKTLLRDMEHVAYCKTGFYGSCALGVLRIPDKKNPAGSPFIFGYYIQKNLVILIDSSNRLKPYFNKMEELIFDAENAENQLFLCLLNDFVDDDIPILQKLEDKLASLEDSLLEKIPAGFSRTLMSLRKGIRQLHSFYAQLLDLGEEMQNNPNQRIPIGCDEAWTTFLNRVSRLHNYAETLREYVLQIHELYQSQIDLQQNKNMAILTIVTTVFLPLSLLAAWYGMNFKNMPLINWEYGYPIVIAVTVILIIAEILYIMKKGFFKK